MNKTVDDRSATTTSGKPVNGAWNRTLLLTQQSFGVLQRDKKLMTFPVAAGVSAICVAVSFLRPLFDDGSVGRYMEEGRVEPQTALWLFLWYYFHYFVVLFFNSALIAATNARMEGRNPSLTDGLRAAVDRLFPISMWTLAAATFGVLIRILEGRSKTLASYVSAMIGLTWSFATFFVGPVLMFEESRVFPGVKRSVEITRRAWGDQISNQASFGLFSLLLAVPGLLLAAAGLFFSRGLLLPALAYGLMLSVVLSAARTVFTVALYRYAVTGQIPDGFSREAIVALRAN